MKQALIFILLTYPTNSSYQLKFYVRLFPIDILTRACSKGG
jgi:hypothetical protein